MQVKELLKITRGRLLSGEPNIELDPSNISLDSRTIRKGDFFIALKGPNFDGSDFIEDAFKKGAIGAVSHRFPSKLKDLRKICIEAKDTLKALQDIARHHRMRFKIPVIAITGSNGKTTVKEMVWKILASKYDVLKNEGTKNNHIGVPQTLIQLKSHHQICVLELGMNHKGEIGLLAILARPTIALITNIGPSHLEFLNGLDGVFESKKEILDSLDANGLAILNGDDEFLSKIRKRRFGILRFGLSEHNDFRATDISIGKNGLKFRLRWRKAEFRLALLGIHNIYNALAAIAVASQFGIDFESMGRALSNFEPSRMRLNLIKMPMGVDIIDDTYNSNPLSMECALDALKNYPANGRWVVFGDMLELGNFSRYFHNEMGMLLARSEIKGLLTFGKLSRATRASARRCGMDKSTLWHCPTHADIARILRKATNSGDVVLVKGSRAMRMEEVVKKLITHNS